MNKNVLMFCFMIVFHFLDAQRQEEVALEAQFDRILSDQFKPEEPGGTVLIGRKGQVIYKRAFGMADLELNVPMQVNHVMRIGSITKQFTAVAILQLAEAGRLSLQDDITRFLPEYPTQGFHITVEHLLTHTSGIRNYSALKHEAGRGRRDISPTEMIDFFKNEPMRFEPGTKWEYSNSGYFLLGYIIEKVTGMTYGEYLEERIFKPLGMQNTRYGDEITIVKNRASGYSKNDTDYQNADYLSMTQPYAAGSIMSTVEDLFIWQRALLSFRVISKESLDKAYTRYTLADGKETNYGYGWRMGYIQESPSLWHGGGINGFMTMAMYLPVEDVFVAVFSNCDCNSPEDVTAKLAAAAIGKPYEYTAIHVEDTQLKSYTGVYENSKGQQRIISMSDSQLFSQLGRGPKFVIESYQTDKFFFKDNPFLVIDFVRDHGHEVVGLVTKHREGSDVWQRTNKPFPLGDGIQVDSMILDTYVGRYEIYQEFNFTVTREDTLLFVQGSGQDKFEIYAETESFFFTKINDATFRFITDEAGVVTKVLLNQGGRTAEAVKIKE